MYIMLKPLEIVYLVTCMTLNSNMKKYYRDGHYMGFQGVWRFFLICVLSMHSKRVLSFDSCRFLLLGRSLNVIWIWVLKFDVYNKRPSSRKSP